MYCTKCGNETKENDLFCSNCGNKSASEVETSSIAEIMSKTAIIEICRVCNKEKSKLLKDDIETGKSVCISCVIKSGSCPNCNTKLKTKYAQNCENCNSSWSENITQTTTAKTIKKNNTDNNKIRCPKCKSINVIGGKKGFSGTQAVGGAIITGGIGILAGTIGSNKVELSCLSCGNKFKPGQDFKSLQKKRKQEAEAMKSLGFWIFLIVICGIIIFVFKGCFG